MCIKIYQQVFHVQMTSNEKAVLLVLAFMANAETKQCWPRLEHIRQGTNLHKITISKTLKKLSDKNWIKKEKMVYKNKRQKNNIYTINVDIICSSLHVSVSPGLTKEKSQLAQGYYVVSPGLTENESQLAQGLPSKEKDRLFKERGERQKRKSPAPIIKKINGFLDGSEEEKRAKQTLNILLGRGRMYEN